MIPDGWDGRVVDVGTVEGMRWDSLMESSDELESNLSIGPKNKDTHQIKNG